MNFLSVGQSFFYSMGKGYPAHTKRAEGAVVQHQYRRHKHLSHSIPLGMFGEVCAKAAAGRAGRSYFFVLPPLASCARVS